MCESSHYESPIGLIYWVRLDLLTCILVTSAKSFKFRRIVQNIMIILLLQMVYKLITMFTDLDDASADKVQAYLEK